MDLYLYLPVLLGKTHHYQCAWMQVGQEKTWLASWVHPGFCQINWGAKELRIFPRILFWCSRKRNEAWRGLQKKKNESLGISPENYCTKLGIGGCVHSDAGISEVAILKSTLPVSLSHLTWTVHISPGISLTCRFFLHFLLPTIAWALVTLVICKIPLTHPYVFRFSALPLLS